MLPLIETLVSNGLGLIANAVLARGKAYVKEKTRVDLDKEALSQEDLIALKKYEMEHEEELLRLRLQDDRLSLEEQKIVFEDLSSARNRQMAIVASDRASWLTANTPSLLAISTVALTFVFFAVFAWLGKYSDPANAVAKEIMLYVLGVLSAILTQIFSYYFGSSHDSTEKARAINEILDKQGASNEPRTRTGSISAGYW
ncbi:MAG TPA: hypothetical protein VHJ19_02485 [Gammaproteobacteria bacterium]|nr:hypothetical protein [Gammaproteobacteria bacterium]